MANLRLLSGFVSSPSAVTHVLDKTIDIMSGEVAVFKICNPPPPPLTTQSLVEADYWDAAAGNSSGRFLYIKNPSKVLTTS